MTFLGCPLLSGFDACFRNLTQRQSDKIFTKKSNPQPCHFAVKNPKMPGRIYRGAATHTHNQSTSPSGGQPASQRRHSLTFSHPKPVQPVQSVQPVRLALLVPFGPFHAVPLMSRSPPPQARPPLPFSPNIHIACVAAIVGPSSFLVLALFLLHSYLPFRISHFSAPQPTTTAVDHPISSPSDNTPLLPPP